MTTLGNATRTRTPTGLRVAPMSYAKIEAAANVLRPLLPVQKAHDRRFTLDAWRVLEQTLPRAGFHYRVAEIAELHDCAGLTAPAENLVVIRSDVYEGLFTGSPFSASTVIHELSHIALGHAITLQRSSPAGQHKFYEDSEWQAKAMTAALMMPEAACKEARSAVVLAGICGTSVEAATYRLERLSKERLI